MPLTDFTCPNGHDFKANAKLRARCPECGSMARRFGASHKPPEVPKPESTPDPTKEELSPVEPESVPEPPKPTVKIVRRGRVRNITVAKPKPRTVVKKTGLITHKKVRSSNPPVVKAKPRGNREHKVVEAGRDRPFWHDVADKYGIG